MPWFAVSKALVTPSNDPSILEILLDALSADVAMSLKYFTTSLKLSTPIVDAEMPTFSIASSVSFPALASC